MLYDFGKDFVSSDGQKFAWEDGDTLVDDKGAKYRIKGFDTAEVEHEEGAPTKGPGTTYGYAQTAAIADIVSTKGFNNIEFGDKDIYGRTLINITDNNGVPLENKLYAEGLLDRRAPMTFEQQEAYDRGDLFRRMNPELDDKYYDSARSMLDQSKTEDIIYNKPAAPDEWWNRAGKGKGIFRDPYIRRGDRNVMNKADSTLFSSIGAGIDSMQAGLYGLAQATGNRASIKALEDFGTKGVFLNTEAINSQRPDWVRSYKQINTDDWGKGLADGVDWAVGLFGSSLPYFLPYVTPIVRGVAPLGLGATFAGQVWNDMEGPLEDRSFTTALIAGIAMATIDKLAANKLTTLGLTASSFTGRESLQKAVQTLAKNNDLSKAQASKILKETQLDTMVETFSDIVTKMGKPDLMKAIKLSKTQYAKGIAGKAGTGFMSEGITEGLQETIQYGGSVLGSEKEWKQDDYNELLINAVLGGGLLGAGFGTAGGIYSNPQELRRLRDKYADAGMYQKNTVDIKETLDAVPVSDSYVIENEDGTTTTKSIFKDKIVNWLDEALFDRNKNGLVNRTWGDFLDRRYYRSNTEINKDRIGPETWMDSPVTRALSEKYGWVPNRTTSGPTYEQSRRRGVSDMANPVQSLQQSVVKLFGIKRSLADRLGTKTGSKASAKAYSKLMDYAIYKDQAEQAIARGDKVPETDNKLYNDPSFRAKADALLDALVNDEGTGVIDKNEALKLKTDPNYRDRKSRFKYDTTSLSQFKIKKNRQDFIHRLQDKFGMTREEAIEEANAQSDTPIGYKADQYEETTPEEKAPIGAARRPKSSRKKVDYFKNDDFKDFFVEDGFASLMQDAVETSNWANDMENLGKKGEKIYSHLNAAMEEHGDPEFVRGIVDNITALRGTYNKIESEKLRKIQTVIGTVQMYAYLPFAALASLPELAVTYLGLDNIPAITRHTKESGKQLARALLPFMKDKSETIFGNADEVRKFERSRSILYNEGHLRMEHSAVSMVDVDSDIINMSKRMRNISDAYFKIILLKPFTDYTRLLRASSGQDFVMEKMDIVLNINLNKPLKKYQRDAISMLQELGVDPIDMAGNHQKIVKNFSKESIDTLDFDKIVSHLESKKMKNDFNANKLLDQYATAVTNFVDAGIVNPDPTKRPLFYSDDRFRLLFQFQGFMSVFTTTILRKMWKDVVKGNPAAQYSAFVMLTTMMMLGFASQAIRDELKYQGTPAWLTDSKKVQRAVGASGVIGQGERLLNIFFPLWAQDENLLEKAYGELGPAARTAANLQIGLGNLSEGDIEMAANQALKLVPGLGVSTSSRQAAAKKIGNFFE